MDMNDIDLVILVGACFVACFVAIVATVELLALFGILS